MLTAILSLHCLSRLSAAKDYKGPAHTLSNYNFKPVFDQNATLACSRYLVWFQINAITKFTDLQPDNLSCADKSCVSVGNWFAIVVVTCVLGLRVRRLYCLTALEALILQSFIDTCLSVETWAMYHCCFPYFDLVVTLLVSGLIFFTF